MVGDVRGLDVLEYGCGAAQWSIALAADGARVVGARPVARAAPPRRALAVAASGASVPLVCASGEAVPLRRRRRSTSCSATTARCRSATPSGRSPRWPACSAPGGRLVFSHTHAVAVPRLEPETGAGRPGGCAARTSACAASTTATARAPIDFQLPYGDWIRLLPARTASSSTTWSSCAHRSTRARATPTSTHVGHGGGRPNRSGWSGRREPSSAPRAGAAGTRRLTSSASPRRRRTRCRCPNAVCCSPSTTSRRPRSSCRARLLACTSGVAGSRVVPTTRIGGAPAAVMRPGGGSGGTGHTEHGRLLFTMNAPMRGATATARCSSAAAAATSPTTGPSRQVTAQNASSTWSSRPSPSRPTNASANPSSVDASPCSAASRASASSGQAGRPRYSSWRTPASKRVWFRRRPSGSLGGQRGASGPGPQRVVRARRPHRRCGTSIPGGSSSRRGSRRSRARSHAPGRA